MKENLKTNLLEMPSKIDNGEGSPKTNVISSACQCMKFEKLGQGNKLGSFCFDIMMVRKRSLCQGHCMLKRPMKKF